MILKSKILFLVLKEQNGQSNSSCSNNVINSLQFYVFPWIENFILIWIFFFEIIQVQQARCLTCSVENFRKWSHKIVVGKSWVMKLRKISTMQKIRRINWTVTAIISRIYFLFLLLEVSSYMEINICTVFFKCIMVPLIFWEYRSGGIHRNFFVIS